MRILGLDLGTHTGYACDRADGGFDCGTWELATKKHISVFRTARLDRRRDPRIPALFDQLKKLHAEHKFDIVAFEDCQFSSYTQATQLWSSFRAAVWLAFGPESLIECVPVTTLKKFATGAGNAKKEDMRAAFVRTHPFLQDRLLGEDAIDAFWVWRWAKTNLSRTKV